MNIKIAYDATVDATYITLSDKKIVRTVQFNDDIMIDVDQYDMAVGVEILDQYAPLPFTELCDKYHVHSDVIALLKLIRPDVNSFLRLTVGNDGAATTPVKSAALASLS